MTMKENNGHHRNAALILVGLKEVNVNIVEQEKYIKGTSNITTDYLKND